VIVKSSPTNLAVYDFDGTLFRTTDKPVWFVNKYKWWGVNPQSLNPPCIPESPGGDWWVKPVLGRAKKNISDSSTLSILLTGRVKEFSRRVQSLLAEQGLWFDRVYFLPSTDLSVKAYKIEVLTDLLEAHPTIKTVDVWEDQNLGHYVSTLKSWAKGKGRDISVQGHNVRVQPHENLCGPEDFNPETVDWSLTPAQRQAQGMLSLRDYEDLLGLSGRR
jgi:hypothetical protein